MCCTGMVPVAWLGPRQDCEYVRLCDDGSVSDESIGRLHLCGTFLALGARVEICRFGLL